MQWQRLSSLPVSEAHQWTGALLSVEGGSEAVVAEMMMMMLMTTKHLRRVNSTFCLWQTNWASAQTTGMRMTKTTLHLLERR